MNSTIQSKVDNYVYYKMVQSIAFRSRVEDILENKILQNDINSIIFLNALKDIIQANTYQQIIEAVVRDSLLKVINHLRFNKSYQSVTEKKESYETFNNLIRMLNTSKDTNKYKFYARELCKRYNQFGLSGKILSLVYTPTIIEMDKQYLFDSISNDFSVIANQSELVDDYNFKNKVMADNLNNHYYIDSINAILTEQSYMFCDLTFLDRTYDTLEGNLEVKEVEDKYLLRRNTLLLKRMDNIR